MRLVLGLLLVSTSLTVSAIETRTVEERLADECARGFKKSCEALRKISDAKNGVPEPTRCVTVGNVDQGGSSVAVTKCK